MGDAKQMDTPRQSIAARVRRSAASLGLFDYGVTLALLAVYVIGTNHAFAAGLARAHATMF
jgi:hypothetical protein